MVLFLLYVLAVEIDPDLHFNFYLHLHEITTTAKRFFSTLSESEAHNQQRTPNVIREQNTSYILFSMFLF